MFITPDVHNLGYSMEPISVFGLLYWTNVLYISLFSWASIRVQSLFFDVLNLGLLYGASFSKRALLATLWLNAILVVALPSPPFRVRSWLAFSFFFFSYLILDLLFC